MPCDGCYSTPVVCVYNIFSQCFFCLSNSFGRPSCKTPDTDTNHCRMGSDSRLHIRPTFITIPSMSVLSCMLVAEQCVFLRQFPEIFKKCFRFIRCFTVN